MTAKSFAGAALQPAAKTMGKAGKTYAKEFGKGFVDAAKKYGKPDGEKAFKWLRRLAVGGGGAYAGLTALLAKFPERGWDAACKASELMPMPAGV